MNPFGTTRSRVTRDHALIAPESHVPTAVPGWRHTQGVTLISPHMGARFSQTLALLEPGGGTNSAVTGHERFVYVLEGEIEAVAEQHNATLRTGGYLFVPAGSTHSLTALTSARLLVFEKPFIALPGSAPPHVVIGQEQEVTGKPFLGDPDALLQVLLPDEPAFDMAINIFTYQPGATLPMVEVHVMEHGLLMIQGAGVYRLADSWYPVQEGDTIWMASYCPQWFVAMGKTPARYIYYKDVNRDALENSG